MIYLAIDNVASVKISLLVSDLIRKWNRNIHQPCWTKYYISKDCIWCRQTIVPISVVVVGNSLNKFILMHGYHKVFFQFRRSVEYSLTNPCTQQNSFIHLPTTVPSIIRSPSVQGHAAPSCLLRTTRNRAFVKISERDQSNRVNFNPDKTHCYLLMHGKFAEQRFFFAVRVFHCSRYPHYLNI